MSAALAIWSTYVEPGRKTTLVAQSDIRITGAALDAKLADEKARSSVKLTYMTPQAGNEDEELPPTMSTILCSLTPGKIEQSSLNLVINEDDEVEFEVIGKNVISISGNYITQPTDFPVDDSELESGEEAYDLRDVSSDVEMDPSELDALEADSEEDDSHRSEKIHSEDVIEEKETKKEESSPPASRKRPCEADAGELGAEGEQRLSKKQQKKLNKKLKAEIGGIVPNGNVKQEGKVEVKKDGQKNEKQEKKKGENGAAKKQNEMKVTSSGLKIKDHKTGQGKAAKKGDWVSIRYIGEFMNGNLLDSNVGGKPLEFRLGNGKVIKGWDEGIVGMQAGGERMLIVPPNLGYGSHQHGGIPAGSTLKFKCKLLEIKS